MQLVRIAFTMPADGTWTGGLNYMRSLMHAIGSVGSPQVELVVYVGRRIDTATMALPRVVSVRRTTLFDRRTLPWLVDAVSRRLWQRAPLHGRMMRRDGINLHSHGYPAIDPSIRTIGWIPDFQHVHLPHLFSRRELQARYRDGTQLATRCDLVLLSSHDALQDFLRFAPQFANKARVLQFAALPQDHRAASLDELKTLYGIDRPFFYVPNQFWVHKNHAGLLAALKQAVEDLPDLLVVCSGSSFDARSPDHYSEMQRLVQNSGLARNIRFLGLVPYAHVAPLMIQSTAVINPSFFEGWSTTVEEAKALGVPMLLSDLAVHREQCAQAQAVFFDPASETALAALLCEHASASFPKRSDSQIDAAIAAHALRVRQFGDTYLSLVNELVG